MEEKHVLTFGEGDIKSKYLIERVIRDGDKNYFTLFDLIFVETNLKMIYNNKYVINICKM